MLLLLDLDEVKFTLCPSRRFSEIEILTALALIVGKYHVTVKEGHSIVEDSHNGRKYKTIDTKAGVITLVPKKVPLSLGRRVDA